MVALLGLKDVTDIDIDIDIVDCAQSGVHGSKLVSYQVLFALPDVSSKHYTHTKMFFK